MDIDINFRQNQLTRLQNYLKDVDIEVTMILQNLQWDRAYFAKQNTMVTCQYDKSHRVPPDKLMKHEDGCLLKSQGYTECDRLLPSPFNRDAATVVKLSADNIQEILNNGSLCQPLFKRGTGCSGHQPLTTERLQATYTADERRVIHDAVVNRVPFCHDLSDLACLSSKDGEDKEMKTKSRLEILAELRDMRRRRTKYRVAAKTRNYSDVLRDVITTQMELYGHNSMSQIHMKNDDSNGNKVHDDSLHQKIISKHDNTSNRRCHNNDGETSISTNNMRNLTQHPKNLEDYKFTKRRHNDAGSQSCSRRSSAVQDCESQVGKTDQFKDYRHCISNSRSKQRADKNGDSSKSYRNRDKHAHYDILNRHHDKEYDRSEIYRTEKQVLNTTKDKVKDRYNYYNKSKDMYHDYVRHHSNRKRHGHYDNRTRKLSPKSKDDVDRQNRNENQQKQNQTATIKKKKNDCSGDDCRSSEDGETDHLGTITRFSNVAKIKKEKEISVKREGNHVSHDRIKDYRPKTSNTINEYQKFKMLQDRRGDSAAHKNNYKYCKKNDDRQFYDDSEKSECRENAVHKIKEEKK